MRALAKINLGLKVLYRRPDGYHELRTVFQTVSLADTIDLEFRPGRTSAIEAVPEIAGNLAVLAAERLFETAGIRGSLRIRIAKKIPMGSGLGGGSSDAAAVLLALPVLAGSAVPMETLIELGGSLGSDVPFFLLGGAAVALGRGTELYPLPDTMARHGLIVTPGIHVSTPEAYRRLGRPGWEEAAAGLTGSGNFNYINSFQAFVWGVEGGPAARSAAPGFENDFEPVVFDLHPRLEAIKRTLEKLGGSCVSMSGSGSAIFALFGSREQAVAARRRWPAEPAFLIRTVNRSQYRRMWWKSLASHLEGRIWPLRSRYKR